MALPLAPVQRFEEGLNVLTTAGDRIAVEYPAVLQFLLYMRTTWLPLRQVISVVRASLEVNNICQRFRETMERDVCGIHRDVWAFFGAYVSMNTRKIPFFCSSVLRF